MREGDASPAEVFNEPYPCEDCLHAPRCATLEMSCESFHIYVTDRGRLDLEHRSPSHDWYRRTFTRRGKADRIYERLLLLDQAAETSRA